MHILIVGSGGREHAIAWKIAQSPRVTRLSIAPGNAGTSALGQNVAIQAEDVPGLVAFARQQAVNLVVIGPDAVLAAGLTDAMQQAGIRTFGPTQAAAQIESSKVFSKEFMLRHAIPTARFSRFDQFEQAMAYLAWVETPVVIKASGLAAGKGVIVPETPEEAQAALRAILLEHQFGAAGDQVIIEERLSGEEVSLLAFSDGYTVSPMPPAQDHKRIFDGDRGPNTGGMGAYAPTPLFSPEQVEWATRNVLQPAIDGMRAEGMPFVGVLYAGLMLTSKGTQVLEFNSRFGDPETQVILPLLESDLLEIIEACIDGKLHTITPIWKASAAATIVLASEGYPAKPVTGRPINGLQTGATPDSLVFHAGTRSGSEPGQVLTSGGRVLNVTGLGSALPQALEAAYAAVAQLSFEGMQFRRDIGRRGYTQNEST